MCPRVLRSVSCPGPVPQALWVAAIVAFAAKYAPFIYQSLSCGWSPKIKRKVVHSRRIASTSRDAGQWLVTRCCPCAMARLSSQISFAVRNLRVAPEFESPLRWHPFRRSRDQQSVAIA